jgi:hypothetical protein
MTRPEGFDDEPEFSHKRYWTHLVLWSVGLSFALMGGVIAFIGARNYLEDQSSGDLWAALIAAPLTLVAGWYLVKTAPDFTMGEPHTPRGNRARWLLIALVIVGIATSIPILTADPELKGRAPWSNSPLPFVPAMIACAIWGIALPILTLLGRKTADEHTLAGHDFGMMVGGQVFTLVAPVWWMGWRGGFFPEPDVMILFVFVLVLTWTANMWKRYA